MAKVVLYPTPNNDQINIIIAVGPLPIEEIAKKDVPDGVPYLIVDESVLPTDRTYRPAWNADFSNPHGVGIGHDNWFKLNKDKLEQFNV